MAVSTTKVRQAKAELGEDFDLQVREAKKLLERTEVRRSLSEQLQQRGHVANPLVHPVAEHSYARPLVQMNIVHPISIPVKPSAVEAMPTVVSSQFTTL